MMVKDVLFTQFGWWIQLVLTLAILVLGTLQFLKLYVGKSTTLRYTNISALLVLGIVTAVLGVLFQIMGIVMALEAIIEAADLSPQMVLEGLKISFYTSIYGLIVFCLSALIWYVNKIKWEINTRAAT